MLKWNNGINLLIMQEMFGKERLIICPVKINSGLNMLSWKKLLGNMQKLEMFLPNGWNGFQVRKHG